MKMKFTFIVSPDQQLRRKFLLALYDRLAAERKIDLNLINDGSVESRAAATATFGRRGKNSAPLRDGNLWLRQERKVQQCGERSAGGEQRVSILQGFDRLMHGAPGAKDYTQAETDGRQMFNCNMARNFIQFLHRRSESAQRYFLGINSLPWLLCFLGWGQLSYASPTRLRRLPDDFLRHPTRDGLACLERAGWEFINRRKASAHLECLFLDFPRYRFSWRPIQFPAMATDSFREHRLWFAKGEIYLRPVTDIFEQCAGGNRSTSAAAAAVYDQRNSSAPRIALL